MPNLLEAPPVGLAPFQLERAALDRQARDGNLKTIPLRFLVTGLPYAAEAAYHIATETMQIVGINWRFGLGGMGASTFITMLSVSYTNSAIAALSQTASIDSTILDDYSLGAVSGALFFPPPYGFYLDRGRRISVLASLAYRTDPTFSYTINVAGCVTLYYRPTGRQG